MVGRVLRFPKALRALLLLGLVLVVIETLLQVRAYVQTGESILYRLRGESAYEFRPDLGLKILRPNRTFGGHAIEIRSNSFGLRSPEIPVKREVGSIRIAVLGASTVMGTYSKRNELTFPSLLESKLRQLHPTEHIDVINAGIAGLGISQQTTLFKNVVAQFGPDLTIVYPGFNDFGGYCRAGSNAPAWQPQPIANLSLPPWVLSVELLRKNLIFLRPSASAMDPLLQVDQLNTVPYRANVAALLDTLEASHTKVWLALNARAYRPEQPLKMQTQLAATARYYNPCFAVTQLHALYDVHNDIHRDEAVKRGVHVLPIPEVVPGDDVHFADSSHFSARGEELLARWLAGEVSRHFFVSAYQSP